MEGFLESVLPVLIVAAFVGSRIVFMLKRRRAGPQRQASAPAGTAAHKPDRDFAPREDPFRDDAAAGNAGRGPVQTAPAVDDEAFSAWNLSVDDDPPRAAPSPRLPDPPRPLAAALTGIPEAPPPAQAAPKRRPEQGFRGLPPAQRGVIWAEILGAPKGLQD
jgi:hypothetical protein